MVVNNMHLPWQVQMIAREDDARRGEADGFGRGYGIGGPQRGTPLRQGRTVQFTTFASLSKTTLWGNRRRRYDDSGNRLVQGLWCMDIGLPYSLAPSSPPEV